MEVGGVEMGKCMEKCGIVMMRNVESRERKGIGVTGKERGERKKVISEGNDDEGGR